jgi:Na+-driven multidrug efflux pump
VAVAAIISTAGLFYSEKILELMGASQDMIQQEKDTPTPAILNFFGFWMFQIPLEYLLALKAGIGPVGVFWAIVISESALTLVTAYIFKQGGWKKIQV